LVLDTFTLSTDLLKAHKSNETRASIINDATLQGLLDNIRVILTEVKDIKDLKASAVGILLAK
jgi:hypothetical protein